jgi:SET domain-containing protein
MNHSDGPNTYEKPDGTYAARDIEAGEELTCDYSNFGLTPEDLTFNNSIFINSEENKLVVKSQ